MWQWATGLLAGYACRSHCGEGPCRAKLSTRLGSRPFKLSLCIHSAHLDKLAGPGLVQNQRPYVCVTVGDKTKETELGDWSKEANEWRFREVITFEVNENDEVSVGIFCTTKYHLWVASVSLTSHRVGEVCFPISAILPRLRQEDRDTEGIFYITPVLAFDAIHDGKNNGRVFASFETTQPPPQKGSRDGWCNFSGAPRCYEADDDDASMYSDLDNTDRSAIHSLHPVLTGEVPHARPVGTVWRDVE